MKDYTQLISFAKKYSSLVIISLLGFFFVPDIATFQTMIFQLSIISGIILGWLLLVGTVSGWGIFPDIDLKELCDKATDSYTSGNAQIGAGLIFVGLMMLLCTVIFSILR